MFGREPQLPVDFLLGTDEVSGDEAPEEWVKKHQESLKTVYDHVRQQMEAKAEQRNQKHNQQVTDPGLEEGQLVYRRNHQVRGRNKIQDLWHSCLYRVVSRPPDQGQVYTITPVHQDGPAQRVHRTELRSAPEGEGPDDRSASPVRVVQDHMSPVVATTDSDDSMILVLDDDGRREPAVRSLEREDNGNPLPTGSPVQNHGSGLEASDGSEEEVSPQPPSLRRSSRSNAGFHSNPHRLPYRQPVCHQHSGGD